jgi:GNAT superfamily N-acetyltransferase
MSEKSDTGEFTLRRANEGDIPLLSIHHRKMFEEIWISRGLTVRDAAFREFEQAYAEKLHQELPTGLCISWLAENSSRIVASGAVTIASFVPTPSDFSSKVAYLHSIYTEKSYRNKNLAKGIVNRALQYCRDHGIRRALLSASEAGRPIYEKIGFVSAPETMKIFIE